MKYVTAEEAAKEIYRRAPHARGFADRLEQMLFWTETGKGHPHGDRIPTRLAVKRVPKAWPLKGNVVIERECDGTIWYVGLKGTGKNRKWSARPVRDAA